MEQDDKSNEAEFVQAPAAAFEENTPALKRLEPMPFVGGTFPLMGFFASAYEHISLQAAELLKGLESDVDKQP